MIQLANPQSEAEYNFFYSQITPVKFGSTVSWLDADQLAVARYQVPRESSFCAVLRVECYTVNLTSGAADFGMFEPPPPGQAFWQYTTPGGATVIEIITDQNAPVQRLLDADEHMFLQSGYEAVLIADVTASPDGDTREVRTLVYAYNIGPYLGGRLGRSEMVIPSQ